VSQQPLSGKPLIHVAAGVLQRPSGEVLFTQRPDGKIAAGWWEFPGGKIEDGEAGADALHRELEEELGVIVRAARPLIRFRHEYSNRSVLLDTWLVSAFDGEPQSLEGQAFRWVRPSALAGWPQALPTVAPIVRALTLPAHYVFTRPDADADTILAGLPRLPAGALLRLRLPALDRARYRSVAMAVAPAAADAGLQLVLDRDPALVSEVGAAGWHASAETVRGLNGETASTAALRLASAHDAAGLQRARALGFDAAVLGSVLPTASHPDAAGLGWNGFEVLNAYAGLPVYAIGGVGPQDLSRCVSAWAQGVAGISAYWPAS
jgi:8-oxo-dGTP diphosphatase